MSEIRQQIMRLMDALEAAEKAATDPRVKKALRRGLANLNRLFAVVLIVD